MDDFDLSNFVSSEVKIQWSVWEEKCRNRVEDEYGVPVFGTSMRPLIQLHPDESATQLEPEICWAHVPGDAVTRLRNADDVASEFIAISNDTYSNLIEAAYNDFIADSEARLTEETTYSVEDMVRSTIAQYLVARFRGDIDPSKIFSNEVEDPDEPLMDPPDGTMTILIERLTENQDGVLARDQVEYEIEVGSEFFGNTYGHASLMVRKLINSDIAPRSVEYDIEFQGDIAPIDKYDWAIPIGV